MLSAKECKDLRVAPTASLEELQKARQKRVLQTHPDKGGDAEEFRLVQQAYEALTKQREDLDRIAKQAEARRIFGGNGPVHHVWAAPWCCPPPPRPPPPPPPGGCGTPGCHQHLSIDQREQLDHDIVEKLQEFLNPEHSECISDYIELLTQYIVLIIQSRLRVSNHGSNYIVQFDHVREELLRGVLLAPHLGDHCVPFVRWLHSHIERLTGRHLPDGIERWQRRLQVALQPRFPIDNYYEYLQHCLHLWVRTGQLWQINWDVLPVPSAEDIMSNTVPPPVLMPSSSRRRDRSRWRSHRDGSRERSQEEIGAKITAVLEKFQ